MEISLFYKQILTYFLELKTLYANEIRREMILFNNKDIVIDMEDRSFLKAGSRRELYRFRYS